MDILNILQLGAAAIRQNSDQATTGLDANQLSSALGQLLGGESGRPDLGSLITKMQQSGLGDVVTSWLGSGSNVPVSPEAIISLLGSEKVQEFASRFGLSQESAKNAIASALPEIVDKASPEGSVIEGLIGNLGGLDGLSGLVNKLF